jgi:hypothetical protein
MHLRPFRNDDVAGAIAVFRDAILHIASQDYDADQLRVWTQHADDVEGFRTRLSAGVSIVAVDEQGLEAFGQLYIQPITSTICTVGSAVGGKGTRRAF